MPKIRGAPKEYIPYRCSQKILKKIDLTIENKEFSTRADVITAALEFYFENKGKDTETVVKDLFERGRFDVAFKEAVESVVIEVLEEQKKKKK
jgi:metal-responsive CopG/Arc/MetJ family transcriptional regulator